MRKHILLVLSLVISFSFLLSSYIPNFYEISISDLLPQERVMTPAEHIYTYDYNVYLSKIKQGTEGRWTVVDKYTNDTAQKGVFLQMLYLISGKAGGILGLGPTLIFHILRTILSSALILTIIFLNFYYFKNPALAFVGVLFSLLAASWPVFYEYQTSTWVGMHMAWWQEMDVLKRISYIPHYTLNYIIISILTLLLYKDSKSDLKTKTMKQWSNLAIMAIILFISFFIHPASGLLFLISWSLYHFIKFIWKPNIGYLISKIVPTLILILVSLIPLLYFKYVTSQYPWKSLVDFDQFNRYPVNVKDYILALGPVFFTGVLGALLVLIKRDNKYLSLVTWILGAFLAIFAFKKFPLQSELRFVQTANHIPLAILSVYFLFSTKLMILNGWQKWKGIPTTRSEDPFRSEHRREGNFWQDPFKMLIDSIVYGIIIGISALGIVQSYFSIKAQNDFTHQRVVAGVPLVPYPPQVMYPLKDMFNAFIWLDKNTENEDIVLSHIYAGNYLPAYTGNYVYLGHNPETPKYEERVQKLERFYSGLMLPYEAQNFLKDEKISYVFYGPQEREKSAEDIKKYNFLEEVFSSYFIKIYKVIK